MSLNHSNLITQVFAGIGVVGSIVVLMILAVGLSIIFNKKSK